MESIESKNLMKLNEEYLEIYYSKSYQRYLSKNHRKLSIKDIFTQLYTGYFYNRIKSMFCTPQKHKQKKKLCWNNGQVSPKVLKEKVVIYTVIIGNYDTIKEPLYISDKCDYYVITDCVSISEKSIWKKIDIRDNIHTKNLSNVEIARYVKTHPHLFFKDYNYSLFIDGNFLIIADIYPLFSKLNNSIIGLHLHPTNDCIYKEGKDVIALRKAGYSEVKKQLKDYRNEGFPKHFGLFETNVLLRKHNDVVCIKIMEEWWNQMLKYTKRDQLSFTYVLWKFNFNFKKIYILGDNPRMNPRFRYLSHKNVS